MVSALAAVLHRRTGQERVAVHCRITDATGSRTGTVTAHVDGDTVFGELVARHAADLRGLTTDTNVAENCDAVLTLAADGAVLSLLLGTHHEPGTDRRPTPAEEQVLRQVRGVLGAGDALTGLAVGELDLMDRQERLLLQERVAGPAGPPARCVHQLVLEQAERTPDSIAVNLGEEALTYRDLAVQSRLLADDLRRLGAGPGSVIGVLHQRSPQLVVSLLAVLRTGAAYLALDPEDPPARWKQWLDDAGARLILTEERFQDEIPEGVAVLVPRPRSGEDFNGQDVVIGPDAVAYVAYTSGSTGEPKGVAVPHRAIARLVHHPDWISLSASDVFLQLSPVAFDASTLEIWAPLVHGARLAVLPSGPTTTERLAETLITEGVTVLWLTAGLFQRMVITQPKALGGLRQVIAGGDVVSPIQVARLLAACPELRFTNGYGPTENTTFTSTWTTMGPFDDSLNSVPIGRPIGGTRVAVLDCALRPVPTGVIGELYTSGEGLAHGYLNRADATAERFIPDPYAPESGGRMYRTGDLARWTSDGTLEFVGRADSQIKIRGYRVEPGGIETELLRSPEVHQAVVVAQPDGSGGKRLLAYIVPSAQGAIEGSALGPLLRERLSAVLPSHQVPWAVLTRAELPLTPSGKVDRAALPATRRVPRNVWNEYVAPRYLLETELAEMWGELLGVEPVGVEDDLFDLGGHSLLAVDLIEKIRARYGVALQARILYLQPTIAELAENLTSLLPAAKPQAVHP
ncbi:amino acid adenylation domain-containing protein [Sphaerimonospora cavernae]|uniref:Amino acid adenylation domain-containing protein n=1 Tax=Sphaerimonospora cavernae TaxID=1740611 RepID=A0ABV6U0Q7_9ACTN